MLPDLARFGGQFPRSGSFSRCGDLVSRSGQIWPDLGIWEIFFFKKKKKLPRSGQICTDAARSGQIWGPISQIWLVFQMWRSCFQIWPDLARSGNLGNFFFQKKKKTPQIWPDLHGCCQIWPDLGANFPDLARFPDVEILFPDLDRSGQIWESGKFFFSKKKKTPQIWPDLARSGNLAIFFFFFSDFWLLSPRERDSRIFFFAPI